MARQGGSAKHTGSQEHGMAGPWPGGVGRITPAALATYDDEDRSEASGVGSNGHQSVAPRFPAVPLARNRTNAATASSVIRVAHSRTDRGTEDSQRVDGRGRPQ